MIFSLTLATLLAALFAYGVFCLFCPCVSLLYCICAAGGVHWTQFLYWTGGSLLCVVLAAAIRTLFVRISGGSRLHLLEKVHISWLILIVSGVSAIAAALWNGRFLLPLWRGSPIDIAAVICLVLSPAAVFLRRPALDLPYRDLSSILFACAIVLALFPVCLSPLLCVYTCVCAFNMNGIKGLVASHLGPPLLLFILMNFIKDEPLNMTLLLSSLIILALAVYILKLKKAVRESSDRLRDRENEMDLDRRRMDELEVGIVRSERENLLNMLELRRKDVTQAAEKLTSQRTFMQEIYDLLSQAEKAQLIEAKDNLLHEMKSKINLRMNFSDERNDFDTQVEELHKDFGIRLASRFPNLTAQEKKLAAMLRLDFPTKYMAAILNISPKSVEIERHRLRKKFGLDRRTKLTDFVKTI